MSGLSGAELHKDRELRANSPQSLGPAESVIREHERHLDLWATKSGSFLHASPTCCGGAHPNHPRKRVRDHYDPTYFDDPKFKPCRKVRP